MLVSIPFSLFTLPPTSPPMGSDGLGGLMEIPIAMIVACRLLPFRANQLANIVAGVIVTLVNGSVTFIPPPVGVAYPGSSRALLAHRDDRAVCTLTIFSRRGLGPFRANLASPYSPVRPEAHI